MSVLKCGAYYIVTDINNNRVLVKKLEVNSLNLYRTRRNFVTDEAA